MAAVDSRCAPDECPCQRTAARSLGAGVGGGTARPRQRAAPQGVMSRLVALPQQQDLDVSQYPAVTVLMWVVMSAVVVGVVEETSFRGYLQRPIERQHGPVIAILVTGSLFGFAHFAHPEVGLVLAAVLHRRGRSVRRACLPHRFHLAGHGPPCRRQHVQRVRPLYARSIRVAAVGRSPASHLGNGARYGVLGHCDSSVDLHRFDGVGVLNLARAMRNARSSSAACQTIGWLTLVRRS